MQLLVTGQDFTAMRVVKGPFHRFGRLKSVACKRTVNTVRWVSVCITNLHEADPFVFGEADGGESQVVYPVCLQTKCVESRSRVRSEVSNYLAVYGRLRVTGHHRRMYRERGGLTTLVFIAYEFRDKKFCNGSGSFDGLPLVLVLS